MRHSNHATTRVSHCTTNNVKFHFKTNSSVYHRLQQSQQNQQQTQKKTNFCVKRINSFVYIIFNNGHVNVTGVKNFNKIREAVKVFAENFELVFNFLIKSIKIDNSTTSAFIELNKPLNLSLLYNQINNATVSLRPHFFPGAVLRRKHLPTIIVFSTGSIIIIGAKSIEQVQDSFKLICAIMKKL